MGETGPVVLVSAKMKESFADCDQGNRTVYTKT
ncbi:uncharacterized protein METZ01_LOCUS158818 [marine metagenome]|uniref:Uncharacterized protein n=1 Tax=marine metagenome TaxID=408172 RepID=A0A382AX56_9ZZZZ